MDSWSAPDLPSLPGTGRTLAMFDSARQGVSPTAAASMYVCGITPYDATHLGHAATMIAFDLVNRAWRDAGLPVRYVQNVTDIDDPLLERAAHDGEDWVVLGMRETALFREDMEALRILPPTHYVGAVESVPQIAAEVARLLDLGAAYRLDDGTDDVYFDVAAAPRFGYESNLSRPEMLRLLGPTIEVQGGGNDLLFPHHECSAAHAEVLTGCHPFASHYVHAGMIGLHGEKMSKSKGNLVFVSRLRADRVDPMAVRLALLADHYRTDRQWTDDLLKAGEQRLSRWREAVAAASGPSGAAVLAAVRERLAADLDTPGALAVVDAWVDATLAGVGDDDGAPALVASTVDALLGVRL